MLMNLYYSPIGTSFEYPDRDTLKRMKIVEAETRLKVRLVRIDYLFSKYFLETIRFHFSGGFSSPFFNKQTPNSTPEN